MYRLWSTWKFSMFLYQSGNRCLRWTVAKSTTMYALNIILIMAVRRQSTLSNSKIYYHCFQWTPSSSLSKSSYMDFSFSKTCESAFQMPRPDASSMRRSKFPKACRRTFILFWSIDLYSDIAHGFWQKLSVVSMQIRLNTKVFCVTTTLCLSLKTLGHVPRTSFYKFQQHEIGVKKPGVSPQDWTSWVCRPSLYLRHKYQQLDSRSSPP